VHTELTPQNISRWECVVRRMKQELLHSLEKTLKINNVKQDVVALLIIRFNNFNNVNVSYGIETGDEFISQIDSRLQSIVRHNDFMAQTGDNEFSIILSSVHGTPHAILAANKIIADFHLPVQCYENAIDASPVIGIAISPDHGTSHTDLFNSAVIALSVAEQNEEKYSLCSSPGPENELPSDLIIERELRYAFDHGELSLHYQPLIELENHRAVCAEALIRWSSPKYGNVSPMNFIHVLEKSTLLIPVTKWVLNAAIKSCIEFQKYVENFSVSINISPAMLNDIGIVDMVVDVINIWGVPPASIVLEVTEGAIMKNPELSLEILQKFNDARIKIAIDDFGTGYSSLSYLKNLPASELKIDKSFVINMLNNDKDLNIVKTAIGLAHNFGMKVISEGIENKEALEWLHDLGCDYGQGFYIAMPMPYEDTLKWLKQSPCANASYMQHRTITGL